MIENYIPSNEVIQNNFGFFVSSFLLLESARNREDSEEYLQDIFKRWKIMQLNQMEAYVKIYNHQLKFKLKNKEEIENALGRTIEDLFPDPEDVRKAYISKIGSFEKNFWENFKKNI